MLPSRSPGPPKQTLNIVDRPVPKTKAEVQQQSLAWRCSRKHDVLFNAQVPTVSLSAYAYLLSELIQYAMDRASSTGELEDR